MDMINHAEHIFRFDGMLHWCFLLAIGGFFVGITWVVVRVLLPLRRLAKQAASILDGNLPDFDQPSQGIHEIEQLRLSLHYMMEQIKIAQKREVAYRNALTESQENERLRIAREIHDDTIQSLVLVAHNMERVAQALEISAEMAVHHLKNARHQLIATVDGLRQMIANLRPTILDELGLVAALEMLCEKHPILAFSVVGEVYEIDYTQELAIFRAAQEAITNAEHHAQANQIAARLSYATTAVTLEIADDGVGFQIPPQLQEFALSGHYGLIGMQERILHLGGQLRLSSELAVGTRITVTVPTLTRGFAAA